MAGVQGFVGKSSEFFCTSIVNNLWLTNKPNFFTMMQIIFRFVEKPTNFAKRKEGRRQAAPSPPPAALPGYLARDKLYL
jgi:hypothetical protein